jgi:uncharacterized membrane protein
MEYLTVKWVHILSSTVLFGTGIGSAFYLLVASRSRNPQLIAFVAGKVVLADGLFTANTAVLQPLSGFYLVHLAGMSLQPLWLWLSIVLYAVAIGCWLPVVWIQVRLRDIARSAAGEGIPLPVAYDAYFRWWLALGVVAFFAFLGIFWLMVAKTS